MRNTKVVSGSRILLFSGLLLTLPGCAIYSNAVNSLGPDRRLSDLRESVEKPYQLTGKPSPFCHIPSETYIVMPEEGRVGIVSVTFLDGTEQELKGDYSALTLSANQKRSYVSDDDEVDALFGDAVSALPAAPYHAKLYFLLDKDELTPESKVKAKAVFDEITDRQVAEIAIVGHTDTAASYGYNEALSLRRAMKVRQALIDLGIPAAIIETTGQGEYQLLVDTPDSTPEPRNRRVEIDVR